MNTIGLNSLLTLKRPLSSTNCESWIFAAKTTALRLTALLLALTFNLDQPGSLVSSLWQAIIDAHAELADYFVALFNAADPAPLRSKLLGYGIEIKNFARFGNPRRCSNGAAGDN
jgi:hypothetical protein